MVADIPDNENNINLVQKLQNPLLLKNNVDLFTEAVYFCYVKELLNLYILARKFKFTPQVLYIKLFYKS